MLLRLLNHLTNTLKILGPSARLASCWQRRCSLDSSSLSATPDRCGHQQMFSSAFRDLFAPHLHDD